MSTTDKNFQAVSWFWDIHNRDRLEMDPPYQRRSVWNQSYKDYFIDTVLNDYPAPAIFLYKDTSPSGVTKFSVIDGKQRLSTIFQFARSEFPTSSDFSISAIRDLYFKDLPDNYKVGFWNYTFAVEYIPSTDERLINNMFDRINRNVAKLTAQELRHAKFSGVFITDAESLTEEMLQTLPGNFPNLAVQSRKQMKDIELTAQLLLLLEEGPRSYSQLALDEAFGTRDDAWEGRDEVLRRFRGALDALKHLLSDVTHGGDISRSRLRNQADFYSLFGAFDEIGRHGKEVEPRVAAKRLSSFIALVESEDRRSHYLEATNYYDAARSASNDAGPRRTRIEILRDVLVGKQLTETKR